ncbi:unnamed protein product, partial [Mesorhabditis belari]|uniref:DM13 domain-containing protein n=1 Tax=Mesorhabditis belari TaxID=2138241 RepID=A0AAF3ETG1_9BILA
MRESILRPNAIVPWSEYYKRLNEKPNLLELAPRISGDIRRAPQRNRPSDEMLLQQAALAEVMEAAEEDRKARAFEMAKKSKVPYALKPQIRKKLVTEPADFQKLGMVAAKNVKNAEKRPPDYHPPLYPEQYPYMKLNNLPSHPFLTGEAIKQTSYYNSDLKTRIIPKTSYKNDISNEILSEMNYAKVKPRMDEIRMTSFGEISKNSKESFEMTPEMMARYAKAMNIPAGLLRNGVADGVGLQQLPARQLAAPNFVDTGNPLGTIGDVAKAAQHFTRIAPASQVDLPSNSLLTNPFLSQNNLPTSILNPNLGIQQVPLQTNGPNPLETLLSNGNALDQLSKLAKNLLMNEDGGQNNLLAASIKALQRQGSSLVDENFSGQSETRSAPSMMERLMAYGAQAINKGVKEQERKAKITVIKEEESKKEEKIEEEMEKSMKLLQGVPDEQRKLLQKVIENGEVDSKTLEKAINSLTKDDTEEGSKMEKANRLLEWIQKNRPVKTTEAVLSADRLPYYGKYCGAFAEQSNATRKYAGAVWAVDHRRLIVSKFFFQPGSLTENITFWAGPKESTLNPIEDMFPSKNGFYLKPLPINVAIFAIHEAPEIEAKARQKVNASETLFGVTPISPSLNDTPKRKRRDTVQIERDESPPEKSDGTVHLIVKGGMVQVENPSNNNESKEVQEVIIHSANNHSFSVNPTSSSTFSAPFRIQQPDEDPTPDPLSALPLEWYQGFQPLLLTLPSQKSMKTTQWISLWDHKTQKSLTSVVFPNGPAFQVPEITTLRSLSPNGLFNVSSGPIRLIDMKTIEVKDLRVSSPDTPLWFMVGKDILPNANGHIVPLFDKNTFDCDSLMEYKGETVTLRLPGTMDMQDVFWFSIFSLTTGLSYSHIYLPYNDMHLPPDLSAIPTPKCIWKA